MKNKARMLLCAAIAFTLLGTTGQTQGATLYDESVSGDLSNNQSIPNAFTLAIGTNAVIGTLGGTDHQDWIALTVPAGLQLSAVVLEAYSSTDAQGFTGVQAGTNFVGNAGTAGPYLGYAHFGTAATNGALPPTNLVGTDLLPIMGNTTLAVGSQGFTPPLGSGTYTFLLQQTGSSATSYEFDYVVVPEPATAILTALGCGLITLLRRRR